MEHTCRGFPVMPKEWKFAQTKCTALPGPQETILKKSKLLDRELQKPFFDRCNNLYYFMNSTQKSGYLKALLAEPICKSSTTETERQLLSQMQRDSSVQAINSPQSGTTCTEQLHGCNE